MILTRPTVYLAGPMVFYQDLSVFEPMKDICARHGLDGFAPLDNQIDLRQLAPGKATVTKIAAADFELMSRLDGALFCLDPFRRGTEMDTGTAVEIGFMIGLGGKKMAGWTTDGRPYPEKVHAFFNGEGIVGTAPNNRGGISGASRDPDGVLIHSEGGPVQNGMAHCGIELNGGKVYAHQNWRAAFEAAAINLARQFRLPPQEPLSREALAAHSA
jgi:nucleoside 2-deoxyribosyltransferase